MVLLSACSTREGATARPLLHFARYAACVKMARASNMGGPLSEYKYKRVLLKLSGEALMGSRYFGIDPEVPQRIAQAIKPAYDDGVQIAVVVGGGNIYRGLEGAAEGMDRAQGDNMGMLATVINSLALQDCFEKNGFDCRVMSAINVPQVCEPYIRRRAVSHLENGRVIIFAGGTGNPYFTTDTCATLRALEICADAIVMGKNGVEGVYDDDPRKNKDAKLLKRLTYSEVLSKKLAVMDLTAVAMLAESEVKIHVFNMSDPSVLIDVLKGKDVGSTISKE